jgi:hypothetical protein
MKKRILAGVTNNDELYFLEIDSTNDKRNGYDEFSMTGFTVSPIELETAKEQSRENIKSSIEEDTRDIRGLYLRDIDEIVDEVIESDGNLSGLDTSLFDESVEIENDGQKEEYIFTSESCGQHEEKELKHYIIGKNFYFSLMRLWKRYHLKATPTDNLSKALLDTVEHLNQDISDLTRQATQFIIFNK